MKSSVNRLYLRESIKKLFRSIITALVFLRCMDLVSLAQELPKQNIATWNEEQKTDPFRGTSYTQFTLQGKFLAPPKQTSLPSPLMVVRCLPGNDHHGHTHGRFSGGYIATGAVLDSSHNANGYSTIMVQFRLDDGKIQRAWWGHSTNFSAIYFYVPSAGLFAGSGYGEFANLLYAHEMYHKEDTNPQVQKVLIDVPEYLGGEVVMQFDLPDSTAVADTCGIIWHK
jgi:hypothetical protein